MLSSRHHMIPAQFLYTSAPFASIISAARSSFHSKDHWWWIAGCLDITASCHGGPSNVKWKRPVVSLILGIKDWWASCDQTRHSSLPHAKHPQCSKPNRGCEKWGTLQPEQNQKTKKATQLLGFFFSCLLNHVKNGQAESSSLDGRAVGWGT